MTWSEKPFTTKRWRYADNITGSTTSHARPIIISGPDGEIPGVGMFRSQYLIGILTQEDATRLSNELIDAVERPATQ